MKLIEVTTKNLKGEDLHIRLDPDCPVTVFIGENGSSKSTIVAEALHLLARGVVPPPDVGYAEKKSAQAIFDLARDPSLPMVVAGVFLLDDGTRATAERSWTRSGGKISQGVKLSRSWANAGWPVPSGNTAKRQFLANTLAGMPEAWVTTDLTAASPERMRERLLGLVDRSAIRVESYVPDGIPFWGLPLESTDDPLDWSMSAIGEAKERLSNATAELRQHEGTAKSFEDGWAPVDVDRVKLRLRDLRLELTQASANQRRVELTQKRADLAKADERIAQLVVDGDPRDPASMLVAGLVLAGGAAIGAERSRLRHDRNNHDQVLHHLGTPDETIDVAVLAARRGEAEVEVAEAKESLKAAQVDARVAREAHGEVAQIVARHRSEHTRLKEAHGEVSDEDVAELDRIDDCRAVAVAASTALEMAEARAVRAQAQVEAYTSELPISECPSCGHDLTTHWEKLREDAEIEEAKAEDDRRKAQADRDAAKRDLDRLTKIDEVETWRKCLVEVVAEAEVAHAKVERTAAAVTQAEAVRDEALERRDQVAALQDAAEAQAAIDAIDAALRALPSVEDVTLAGQWADAALEDAAELRAAVKARDALEMDTEILAAELASASESGAVRSADAIEADIEKAESELESAVQAQEAAARLTEAQEATAQTRHTVEVLKGQLNKLLAARGRILADVCGDLERRIGDRIGAEVKVRLEDDNGQPDCRLTFDGVLLSSLSMGERFAATFAIVTALAEKNYAKWKVWPADRFESVSKSNRRAILAAMVEACRNGPLDSVLLAGCPDDVPDVDGVQVFRMEPVGASSARHNGELRGLRVVEGGEVRA